MVALSKDCLLVIFLFKGVKRFILTMRKYPQRSLQSN